MNALLHIWHRLWANWHDDQFNYWLDESIDSRMAIYHLDRKQYHQTKL